jgi:hypothetical protein
MIGKIYKTIDNSTSKLLRKGILQVTELDSDGAVHYKYLSVEGNLHPIKGNEYAQDILHFKNHTIELTELEEALL